MSNISPAIQVVDGVVIETKTDTPALTIAEFEAMVKAHQSEIDEFCRIIAAVLSAPVVAAQ